MAARDANDIHRDLGVDGLLAAIDESLAGAARKKREQTPKPTAPAFSDEALALHFADRHANDLRYVAKWAQWLHWDGHRWVFDDTHFAFHLARAICRDAAAVAATLSNKPSMAKGIASAKTEAAVVTIARTDRRLAAVTGQWDADPWLLNTPGGVIDLRTGERRQHRPEDYLTRMTGVAPGGTCPLWHQFLDRITNGDKLLQEYLARVVGYALTGSTREEALFFAHGIGANGKTTFINAISGILGDYRRHAPIETFIASSSDRHPTELAGLRGARLVTAIETEEGRRWAEAKIKALTGGDTISARFMRQDFFEYDPQFKLFIAGNHKPGLRSVDEAIRRRFNLIPFTVIIPPAERDGNLHKKLRDEWPGILSWAIDGCLDWQAKGLDPPEAVTAATAAYLEAEDAISAWIDETCERDPAAWTSSANLYLSWKGWTERSGEYAGSQKRFGQTLEARGFTPRKMTARGYLGSRVKPDEYPRSWGQL